MWHGYHRLGVGQDPDTASGCLRHKLLGIHDKYQALKKHRTRGRVSSRVKEKLFQDTLQDLFDVAKSDALQTMIDE